MSAVLVTGGTGFVGRTLVAALRDDGIATRVLVRPGRAGRALPAGVDAVTGDLEDPASLEAACAGIDTLFHLAGLAHVEDSPPAAERHWRVNAEGTRHLVAAARARGVARMVLVSSVKAMADPGTGCADEDWPGEPATAYGRAKRAAEQALLEACGPDLHGVVLRPALIYGAGVAGNLGRMLEAIGRRRWLPLPAVSNRRSMVDVRDVAAAARMVAFEPRARGRIYILADGRDYSSRQVQDAMLQALGRRPFRRGVPESMWRTMAVLADALAAAGGRRLPFGREAMERLLGSACYRGDRICRELGFRYRFTLIDALPGMVAEAGP